MAAPQKVVVIGGGIGGLSAALELRRRNYDVTLLERHQTIGA
jgi:phytoene dehydrogenase-like protein